MQQIELHRVQHISNDYLALSKQYGEILQTEQRLAKPGKVGEIGSVVFISQYPI